MLHYSPVGRPSSCAARRIALGGAVLLVAALSTSCADDPPGSADRSPRAMREVPLNVIERSGQTMVLAPVSIHGEGPFTFVLDTGASSSAVDDDVARELRLPRTGERQPITGVIGQDVVPVVEVRGWQVGDVRLPPVEAIVVDLDAPRSDRPLEGLLGSDVLSDFGGITVDYDDEVLRLPSG
ncbi:retropepsin-like aspartic protease [Streptomyces sp. HC307]|uniref:retropepsin-like aspartic protease n=1 Tax=Streptomyces flavusporus TaxID=3385496 RepID=UPI0039170741